MYFGFQKDENVPCKQGYTYNIKFYYNNYLPFAHEKEDQNTTLQIWVGSTSL